MKKAFLISIMVIVSVFSVMAQAAAEETRSTVNLAVMQGPTGFSSSGLEDFVNVSVLPSPNEAVAKLVNGELDMAVLPANTAAALYNKGVKIKAIAIVGEGMLSVIGSDENSNAISVPGAGGTPDHMASLLYNYELDYSVTAPAQLAQMLIAGKSKLAILPQPFVSMVLSQNPDMKVIRDVQSDWKALTGQDQYPMSILVSSESFAKEHEVLVYKTGVSYKNSIQWIAQNQNEAGARIEELGIMKAAMATDALPYCALVFKDGNEAANEANAYFKILMDLAPDAIGGKLPDEGFWM